MGAGGEAAGEPRPEVAYRAAVAELMLEVAGFTGPDGTGKAEVTLTRWASVPELAGVLAATPAGLAGSIDRLCTEVRDFRPGRSGADDLLGLIRGQLLAQIDAFWWGTERTYRTDADVFTAAGLVDLDELRRAGHLLFGYRRRSRPRLVRPLGRLWTDRRPDTAGLHYTRARAEMVALLNQIAAGFARLAPSDTPRLWVTGLTRSLAYEQRLRGYAAIRPSAHCSGYAADIEVDWLRRYGAHRALAEMLGERQRLGDLNLVDVGAQWHVCLSPVAAGYLRAAGHRPAYP